MTRVWVLTSGRTGDDKQSLRLAAALGIPFEEKKIFFNDRARAWRLVFGPSLSTVDEARSSALAEPWPDLVISTGWRQVPVVRWIQQRSGGHTKLVQMNRPPGPARFDLILTPPQYTLPLRPNVLPLEWPLQLPPDAASLREARERWQARLDRFPHPWTVLLVGGETHPFRFRGAEAQALFAGGLARARERGGSLMVSTSRRTPRSALEVLRREADAAEAAGDDVFLYEWSADASDNPYVAFLDGGDEFVVTADSVSMQVEVARLGRPLAIAPYTQSRSLWKRFKNAVKRLVHGEPGAAQSRWRAALSDQASLMGLKHGRDLTRASRRMIELGWAAEFPEFGGKAGELLPDLDFQRGAQRVRELIDQPET